MELASAFASYGSEVTVIEVMPALFPAEESSMVQYMQKELKKRGITIYCDTKVKAVEKIGEIYKVVYDGETSGELKADVVLMAAGRKAVYSGIDVEALGLRLTPKKELWTDEYMQTSVPHIYAIGDVAGGYRQLAHAAYAEGEAAVSHILGKADPPRDESVLPRCVYTIPAYAAVGMTEAQAKSQGHDDGDRAVLLYRKRDGTGRGCRGTGTRVNG